MNNANQSANLVAKIDVNTNETTSLTFGATAALGGERVRPRPFFDELGEQQPNHQLGLEGYVKFSQRFADEEESSSAEA